jgi:hypothetical protein
METTIPRDKFEMIMDNNMTGHRIDPNLDDDSINRGYSILYF